MIDEEVKLNYLLNAQEAAINKDAATYRFFAAGLRNAFSVECLPFLDAHYLYNGTVDRVMEHCLLLAEDSKENVTFFFVSKREPFVSLKHQLFFDLYENGYPVRSLTLALSEVIHKVVHDATMYRYIYQAKAIPLPISIQPNPCRYAN